MRIVVRRASAVLCHLVPRQLRLRRGFDAPWYLARYPDVVASRLDPLRHFLKAGQREGRFPNERAEALSREPVFDPAWYLARYPDVAATGLVPLEHFVRTGFGEDRSPNAVEETRRTWADRFDPAWYAERYLTAGEALDPLEHFARVGSGRGFFPNETEAARDAWRDRFDSAWYLARYPDVAAAAGDPLDHFVRFGRQEGRAARPEEEPREGWSGRFDPVWYAARHAASLVPGEDALEHFIARGLLLGFAPNPREEDPAAWDGVFDAPWYLDRYPDVEDAGVDPLRHYVGTGLLEGRQPNGRSPPTGPAATEARIACLKPPPTEREVVLFVTHSPDGTLKPHVPAHLDAIRQAGLACILVVASDADALRLRDGESDLACGIYLRENRGFDFAAWAHVLALQPALWEADLLVLANDSVFGPTSPDRLRRCLDAMRASRADVVGLTENYERGWHVQSYCLALKGAALRHGPLRSFFADVRSFDDKQEVINEYETRLSRRIVDAGLRCEALFPSGRSSNVTLHGWRRLLGLGFPYLKVSAVDRSLPEIDIVGWRDALGRDGYDVRVADATLARMAAARAAGDVSGRRADSGRDAEHVADLHAFLAGGERLRLRADPDPAVSIVLVTRDAAETAYRLLAQIASIRVCAYEAIAVDNGSIDDTACLFGRVEGLTVVEPVEALLPERAAGRAALRARGRALLFLDDRVRDLPDDLTERVAELLAADAAGSFAWRPAPSEASSREPLPADAAGKEPSRSGADGGGAWLVRRDLFLEFDSVQRGYRTRDRYRPTRALIEEAGRDTVAGPVRVKT